MSILPNVRPRADGPLPAQFLPFGLLSTAHNSVSVGISNLLKMAQPPIAFHATAASRPNFGHSLSIVDFPKADIKKVCVTTGNRPACRRSHDIVVMIPRSIPAFRFAIHRPCGAGDRSHALRQGCRRLHHPSRRKIHDRPNNRSEHR